MSDAEKATRADFVIENTGDVAALRERVESVWEQLQAESNKQASDQTSPFPSASAPRPS
jgi:dephospho-CoA kinase